MYSMLTRVNNLVLYTWKSLRVALKPSHHKTNYKKELTLWRDGCVNYLDFGNHSTMYLYIEWIHCTLNMHNNIY